MDHIFLDLYDFQNEPVEFIVFIMDLTNEIAFVFSQDGNEISRICAELDKEQWIKFQNTVDTMTEAKYVSFFDEKKELVEIMTTRNENWDIGFQILKRLPFLFNGPKISVIIPQNEWDNIKEHLKKYFGL